MKISETIIYSKYIFKFLLYYLFSDLKNKHLPPNQTHKIPENFFGVNIASNQNPDTDTFILKKIKELNVKNVRLYFTYKDLNNHKKRLLEKLANENLNIIININPPYEDCLNFNNSSSRYHWKNFLDKFFNLFKSIPFDVEITSTMNRKKWTGISINDLSQIWSIAYHFAKVNKRKIIGPNITDFEPFYNLGILTDLYLKHQLPNIASNNFFLERTIEPEPYDHRIFFKCFANILKFNHYKKAYLLKKISQDKNIHSLISPIAFWTEKRISRFFSNYKMKQAEYLIRYFTLLASHNYFDKVFWGPLICNREGLIDDRGLENSYPELEQVAYLDDARGFINDYKENPSYFAFKFFNQILSNSHFIKSFSHINEIQMHAFKKDSQFIIVAWTMNGFVSNIKSLLHPNDLDRAIFLDIFGKKITQPAIITEKPILILWENESNIKLIQNPFILNHLIIHYEHNYFPIYDQDYEGLIQAKSKFLANKIWQFCNPSVLEIPNKQDALRKARNAIWRINIPDIGEVVIKKPLKIHRHKLWLDKYKANKAYRAWNGANSLLRKGISTPTPIAVFSNKKDSSQLDNYYVCLYAPYKTFNDLALHFQDHETYEGLTKRYIFESLATYINTMHSKGIFFKDLSAGNILFNIHDESIEFSLIDTGRLSNHFSNLAFKSRQRERIQDLVRIMNKFDWATRNIFLKKYLNLNHKHLDILFKFSFLQYDAFVFLKRLRKKIV
ncbi:MAG: lipopolysaccharide kinase InaA family protein [Nitrosomonadales bacterium]